MTNQKAIDIIKTAIAEVEWEYPMDYAAAFDMAIEALKAQEPVQVVQRKVMYMLFWCCGECGVAITEGDKYCRNCGRLVKWKGEDGDDTARND